MNSGIAAAAQQVQALGRAPDSMLAHISPDEARLIDHLQGGTKTNPHTGLPEYGLLGNILKAVVRAGAAIGGFVLSGGNPLAAAAASSAATKLTGGSWSDAAKAGLITGATAGIGNLASSGGSAFMSNSALAGSSANLAKDAAVAAGTSWSTPLSTAVASGAAPAAASAAAPGLFSGLSSAASGIGGLTGAATGVSAIGNLNGGDSPPGAGPVPSLPPQAPINIDVEPANRTYRPYEGDYTKFAEPGGGMGHLFFDQVNPRAVLRQPTQDQSQLEQQFMARGGQVRGYSIGGPAGPLGGHAMNQPSLSGPRMPMGMQGPGIPGAAVGAPSDRQAGILQAAMSGYRMAGGMGFARGGHVHGIGAMSAPSMAAMSPTGVSGPGDGHEDKIPAMLSDNENVTDANTVGFAGNGSATAGHRVMQNIKEEIRKQAGLKNPKQPPKHVDTRPHAVAAMVRRAKQKAGVTKIAPRMA